MQLDEQIVSTSLNRHPLHRTFHATYDRLRGEDASGAVAGRAWLGRRLIVTLTHPLARHLGQAEVADGERLCTRTIAREVLPQLLEHAIPVRLRLHVDEVADDDAADVAQSQLASDFLRGFHIRSQNSFLGILLAGVTTRVHVDRDQRLGRLDDQVTARWQVAAALEDVANLRLDPRGVEDW